MMDVDPAAPASVPAPAPASEPVAPTRASPPARRGLGKHRGTARISTGPHVAAVKGRKRPSEAAALKDSLSAPPASSKRPRRGAAPVSLRESSPTDAEAEAGAAAPVPAAEATAAPTAGTGKKRVIETSEDDEDAGSTAAKEQPQQQEQATATTTATATKAGFKVKLRKPSTPAGTPPAPAPAVPTVAVEEPTPALVIPADPLPASSADAAPPENQETVAPPASSAESAPTAEPNAGIEASLFPADEQLHSPPSTLATPVIAVAEDSDTGSTSAAANGKKKLPGAKVIPGAGKKGPTPSTSQVPSIPAPINAASSPLPVKKPRPAGASGVKPPGMLKPKPKPVAAAPAPAHVDIFNSLFDGVQPGTEQERQQKKEREERASAAAKQKEREEQAKKATLSLAKVSAIADKERDRDSGTEGSDSQAVRKQKQPTKATGLPSFGKQAGSLTGSSSFSDMSRLQQRYGGGLQLRRQELATARAEAKAAREATAASGGFDLLAQGLEMGAFEQPFLKDWNSHQSLVFGGGGKMFPFYAGGPPKDPNADEEDDEEGQMNTYRPESLQHPWTFGAVFACKGSKPAYTPTVPEWT